LFCLCFQWGLGDQWSIDWDGYSEFPSTQDWYADAGGFPIKLLGWAFFLVFNLQMYAEIKANHENWLMVQKLIDTFELGTLSSLWLGFGNIVNSIAAWTSMCIVFFLVGLENHPVDVVLGVIGLVMIKELDEFDRSQFPDVLLNGVYWPEEALGWIKHVIYDQGTFAVCDTDCKGVWSGTRLMLEDMRTMRTKEGDQTGAKKLFEAFNKSQKCWSCTEISFYVIRGLFLVSMVVLQILFVVTPFNKLKDTPPGYDTSYLSQWIAGDHGVEKTGTP